MARLSLRHRSTIDGMEGTEVWNRANTETFNQLTGVCQFDVVDKLRNGVVCNI